MFFCFILWFLCKGMSSIKCEVAVFNYPATKVPHITSTCNLCLTGSSPLVEDWFPSFFRKTVPSVPCSKLQSAGRKPKGQIIRQNLTEGSLFQLTALSAPGSAPWKQLLLLNQSYFCPSKTLCRLSVLLCFETKFFQLTEFGNLVTSTPSLTDWSSEAELLS